MTSVEKKTFKISSNYSLSNFNDFLKFKNEIQFSKQNYYVYLNKVKSFIISLSIYMIIFLTILGIDIYTFVSLCMNNYNKELFIPYIISSITLSTLFFIISCIWKVFGQFSSKEKSIEYFPDKEPKFRLCLKDMSLIIYKTFHLMDKYLDEDKIKYLHNLIFHENKFNVQKMWYKFDADWFDKFSIENNIPKISLKRICSIILFFKGMDLEKSFVLTEKQEFLNKKSCYKLLFLTTFSNEIAHYSIYAMIYIFTLILFIT